MFIKGQIILCGSFLILMVDMLSHIAGLIQCPKGWIYYNNFCYKMFINYTDRAPWIDAYETCGSLGSQLVILNSLEEKRFVSARIQEAYPDITHHKIIWLGCLELDGDWECSENSQKQLGMSEISPQMCQVLKPLSLNLDTGGKPCSYRYRFVCERQHLKCHTHIHCLAVNNNEDATLTTPYCLLDHAYKESVIKRPMQCCIACYKDPNCRSFNLSGKMCQLNNATISQVDADKFWKKMDNCVYYEH